MQPRLANHRLPLLYVAMSEYDIPSSSQGSGHLQDQENALPGHTASSPLAGRATGKLRKPPTITPKRFTRFFTPRLSTRDDGRSKGAGRSGRQLRDITRNAVNRRSAGQAMPVKSLDFVDLDAQTPRKKRKLLPTPESSPIQSSPLQHHASERRPIAIFEEEDEDIVELCAGVRSFPEPIRRTGGRGKTRDLLQRSFGGARTIGRGSILEHCSG